MSRPFVMSSDARSEASFQRQQSRKSQEAEWSSLEWMDDESLLVRQPGAELLSPRAKGFVLMCVLVIVFGALAATQFGV